MQEKTVICVVFLSEIDTKEIVFPVSYTHLDVYKRQVQYNALFFFAESTKLKKTLKIENFSPWHEAC